MNSDPGSSGNPVQLLTGNGRALQRQADTTRQLVVNLNEEEGAEESGSLDLLKILHLVAKWRWVILGSLAGWLAIGLVMILLTTPIFQASTTLQIDREAAKVVEGNNVEPSEMMAGEEFFQTQYGILKSRSLAERVASNLRLYENSAFLQGGGSGILSAFSKPNEQQASLAERRRQATDKVLANLDVAPVRNSRLVEVAYESPDPRIAAMVANAVAENYIDANLERRFESSAYARSFLQDQLRKLKVKLEDSERQLVAYAASQEIINVGGETTSADGVSSSGQSLTTSSLVAFNNALSQARTDRIRAEQRWRQAQAAGTLGLSDILQSPAIQQLQSRRAIVSAEYQDKLKVYKPEFPSMVQLKAQMDEIDRQTQAEVANIKQSLRGQYEVALRQEQSLAGQVGGLKSSVLDQRSRSIQYNILQREVDTNRSLYEGLLQRYKEIGVAGGVGTNNISIVDKAQIPQAPSKPQPFLILAITGLIGLMLGVLAAFALEYLDDSIKVPEDVERKLGVPLLGSIPVMKGVVSPIEALANPRSVLSEAYYSVRTALQFSTQTGVPSSLLVTSARPSEGKSTTAVALAQQFARLGMRVLLVDSDLRNPSLHHLVRADNLAGLSNYLVGAGAVSHLIQASDAPNLFFLPCGPLPPNPAELLAGGRMLGLLEETREHFDLVVIDGPPVMGLADAPLLASMMEGTILVVEAGTTRRGVARNAIRRLRMGNARLLGALLTKFNAKIAGYGYGYSYAYSYNYGEDSPARIESKS